MTNAYRKAGVDVDRGDRLVEFIKSIPSKVISSDIGGFAGGFELDTERYTRPIIMTATDGVGTKLLIARALGVYDTIGIDLVAMCVNDLVASGAEPVSFLDYIACGAIDEQIVHSLLSGIVSGCELADCALTGGETAEMPDVYGASDFDLAGFAVGVAEKAEVLPKLQQIEPGTQLLGLASAGIHANGLSLARKVLPLDDRDILEELLRPTEIYVSAARYLLATGRILAIAHITGGGLTNNIKRIVPGELDYELNFAWHQPWIFGEIQKRSGVSFEEMKGIFNLGIGMVMAVRSSDVDTIINLASTQDIKVINVGEVIEAEE